MSERPDRAKLATLGALLFEGGGEFNHLTWQVHPTFDRDSAVDSLSSLHEWSHHELNNVTSYGLLLTYFAYLARNADKDRERFAELLRQLVAGCQIAHETYATWFSVELLSAKFSITELQLHLPPDYLALHRQGDLLVGAIQSPFLRQQAFLTIVRSCFEAPVFVEFDCTGAERFHLGMVRARDLPNARLEFFAKQNLPVMFTKWGAEYCERVDDGPIASALLRTRKQNFFDLPLSEADAALAAFLRWLSGKWREWISARGFAAGAYECHLHLLPALVDDMNGRCATARVSHPLRATESPHDTASVLLQQMETEIVRLRPQPLTAEFVPLGALSPSLWWNLPVGDPAHLVIQARSLDDLLRQHRLAPSQIPEDLPDGEAPLVFLRRRVPTGSGPDSVRILYFRAPEELQSFRRETAGIAAYGLVSSVLSVDAAWRDAWLEPSILWLSKIDHSISTFLQHCSRQQEVRYSNGTLHDGNREIHFVSFLTRGFDQVHWGLHIGFCGELTVSACLQVIQHKFASNDIVFDREPFEGDLAIALRTIVTHMIRDEFFFSFNQLSYS